MHITGNNKRAYDRAMSRLYMWSDNRKIIEMGGSTDFIVEVFEQNLEHARHVETERLTYCGCFTALIGGGMAILPGIGNDFMCLLLSVILFAVSLLSFSLNERWSNSFDHHITYAKGCYYILHCTACLDKMDPENKEDREMLLSRLQNETDMLDQSGFLSEFEEMLTGLNGKDEDKKYSKCKEIFELSGGNASEEKLVLSKLPLYCFGINDPVRRRFFKKDGFKADTTGTKIYFTRYYRLVSILTLLVGLYYVWAVIRLLFGL